MTDRAGASMSGGPAIRDEARAHYEDSFRDNRNEAIEYGFTLICPICGCPAQGCLEDEWDLNHDGPLHSIYDAIVRAPGRA